MSDSDERTPDGYGAQRAQQLEWALWVATLSAALVVVLAGLAWSDPAGEASWSVVTILLALGAATAVAAGTGIARHRAGRAGVKWSAVLAGVLLVILSLLLATTAIGFLLPVVAVVVLLLAVLKER